MNEKHQTRQNVQTIQRLLDAQRKRAIEESGTPTTALTPDTNATRQMMQDVAASSSKMGIPMPVGATPNENNPALMGNMADPPAANLPVGMGPEQNGVHVPPSQTGGYGPVPGTPSQNPPSHDTQSMGPENDASRQMDMDVKLAKAKGGIPHMEDLEKMTDADLVEAFVLAHGGMDGAIFALVADNCPLDLAEAIAKGELLESPKVRAKLMEIFGSIFKKKPAASDGYQQHLAKRKSAMKSASSGPSIKFSNNSKPSAAWASTSREGNDARRNK